MSFSARSVSLFSALLLGVISLPSAETPLEYRVTQVSGETGFIPKDGKEISPLSAGISLEPGDRLVTGKNGRVEFATRAGTVMELKENSSLTVETISDQVSKFFLKVGRLFGKFASAATTGHSYSIESPVTVAAVRGTELGMCVEETGETQAGVTEGTVVFSPVSDSEESISPVAVGGVPVEMPGWKEGDVTVEESKGIVVKPHERPEHLNEIPPLVVKDLTWFPAARERVPKLREQWKDRQPMARLQLRQQVLRERVKWKPPQHIRDGLHSPKQRMKDRFVPPAPHQPHRRNPPPRRGSPRDR